jgi:xanthine dehydrogenase accessory factor
MNGSAFVPARGLHSRRNGGEWLRPLSGNWPSALCTELEIAPAVVRVVVAAARGSSPREPGTCMLVSSLGTIGTIGGGHLEWQAIQFAVEWLDRNDRATTKRLVLGTQLGQCCGGVVELWIERFTHHDLPLLRSAAQAAGGTEPVLMATTLGSRGVTRRVMHVATPTFLPPHLRSSAEALLASETAERVRYIGQDIEKNSVLLERLDPVAADLWLHGAGHVGQALVRVLAELPVRITWIDSRAEVLPGPLAPNVRTIHSPAPAQEALNAPLSARHLVMTHDHALDYEICRSLLQRNEFASLGLIGSDSKGAKFRSRLRRDGLPQAAIDRLVCPIGIDGVEGKAPSIIAISVAAQLLQTLKQMRVATPLPHYAFGDCSAENCDSCGTRRRASV